MIDSLLHALGGAAFGAALWFGGRWAIVPVVLVFALLREQAQHRDEGWFGWITGHRLWEAFVWAIGAAAVTAAVMTARCATSKI